jgi:predicted aldo/keto reductase-like oxidoreductase
MIGKKGMNRRNFLKKSTMGVVGAGILAQASFPGSEEKSESDVIKVKNYRTLGRTGFKVPDISTGRPSDPAVLRALLDAGITYIDTAESYGRGDSEKTIGQVINDYNRKSIFITSKLHIKDDVTKEDVLTRTRKCLERMKTDYVDCMLIHGASTVKTLSSPGFHAAMKQLKAEGKVKFLGVSNHGPSHFGQEAGNQDSMEKVLCAAAADGRFDVVLLVYNFLQKEMGERILKACKEKNVGTTLMKTNPVGRFYSMKDRIATMKKEGKEIPERYTRMFAQLQKEADKAQDFIKKYNLKNPREIRDAAIRYVISNPDVHTVCCSFRNFDDVDGFLKLSGSSLTSSDQKKLTAFSESCGNLYCRHACGNCEALCPHGVPVNTIMRYNHYFEAQGQEKYAMEKYSTLKGAKADLCQNCQGNCQSGCSFNVPIHGLLNLAHHNLSFKA